MGIKGAQILNSLAQTHKFDRQSHFAGNGNNDAALGAAIQLGQNDTGQTGTMLSVLAGRNLVSNVMHIEQTGEKIRCTTREDAVIEPDFPALLTVERIYNLRLPRILSKLGQVEIWNAEVIGAQPEKCGLQGSATSVLKTFENSSGKRKCRYISWHELPKVISSGKEKNEGTAYTSEGSKSLKKLFIDRKIPAAQRLRIPVVRDDAGVLGVYSIGVHQDRAAAQLPAVTIRFEKTENKGE